jgi:hypothetical protein
MTLEQEIAALSRMTTKQLKRRFAELTGDATSANNRPWLIKRLAWRLQALAHGGLSQRALDRTEELANDTDHETPRALGKPVGLVGGPVPAGAVNGRLICPPKLRQRIACRSRQRHPPPRAPSVESPP